MLGLQEIFFLERNRVSHLTISVIKIGINFQEPSDEFLQSMQFQEADPYDLVETLLCRSISGNNK